MAEARMELADWFDDLSVRFLLNLPQSELESIPRLCFQVEEAQWYYEDFVRPLAAAIGRPLPSMHLRQFCLQLFQHCPLLSGFTGEQHLAAYEEFLAYKVRVPVRGAILLDESMERVVLVKGWKKGASWSFPRGKINKDEKDLDCTVREVWEETGFDIRAAGLVPENDRDVKYIDITMREQHMRMFVFRDVPLDTFFEPKTRKEISKIQWYNLRDLPGFAKRSKNDGESGNTNKFYMVAPFMSHVKKWIGQQRRRDGAVAQTEEQLVSHGVDAQHAVAEESEPYAQPTVHQVVQAVEASAPPIDRSEELKRLLSIGVPSAAPVQQAQAPVPPQPPVSQANHLLAMLQGGAPSQQSGPPPQTPLEQMNTFMPTQPESPHPRHPRQMPVGHQQPPPQFPLSPARIPHSQQHNMPPPPPGFGQSYQGGLASNGLPPQPPQHQFQQAPPSLHGMPPMPPYPQPGGMFNHPQTQSLPPQALQPGVQPRQASMPGQHQIQGQHGAIASGPSAPNASQLPPPRLTVQSMKLLDAFKTGQKPAQSSSNSAAAPRSGSLHQSALLGLFKASPAPEVPHPQQDPRSEYAIVSPGPDEVVQRPAALQERRPTLNEITRSLPLNFKAKRPSQHSPVIPQQMTPAAPQVPQPPVATKPTEEHFAQAEPSAPAQQNASSRSSQSPASNPKVRAATGPKEAKAKDPSTSSAKQIMQRTGARQTPGRATRDKTAASASPARQPKSKPNEQPAPITILARPSSAKGKSGSPAAESPKQAFQPKLLQRHDGADAVAAPTNGHSESNEGVSSGDGNGKRDQLLALFSKSPAPAQAPLQELPITTVTSPPAAATSPPPANTHNNHLLNLFNASAPAQQTSPQASPAPPSAPSLQPAQRPSKPKSPVPPPIIAQPPPNALLDLFKKPGGHVHSPSVESPISPFNLGSPHAMRHGQLPFNRATEQPRSRLGSVASGSGSGTATPTEQKDFLLGFLNGVVQKEGQRK
ncbi:hypothetical protein Q7P37_001859 [Cladosporium fusiforme]